MTARSLVSPMPRRSASARLLAVVPLACVLCAGCGGLLGRRTARSARPSARVVSFRGWRRCVRLDNGLVRVTNAPAVGGRTLEYRLGPYNFLFIGRHELGAVVGDEGPPYRHFGGHFVQLHPEEQWRRLQAHYPESLFMGRYEARIVEGEGAVAVEMTSPGDAASGTQIVRRVELFASSTRVRITDTLTNVRPVPQRWGLHDFLQLKGVPEPSGILDGDERPNGEIGLYVPLNPQSRYPGGLRHAVPVGSGDAQWDTARLPGLLALRYHRRFGKAVLDPALPWLAYVDHSTGHVFVQTCRVARKALLTAGGGYPLIEVQSFAPVEELSPRGRVELVQEWFAARCPGPVVDVTSAGVVSSPLTLLRGEDGLWAGGVFGVFHVGSASVVLRDGRGGELLRFDCGIVHPHRTFKLNRRIELPAATAQVVLEVRDAQGRPVGDLGTVLLRRAPGGE